MGQKANPNSLIIGIKKNWKTEFSEKKKRDLGVIFNKDCQILDFIERILYLNGFILQDYRLHHFDRTIVLFLSIQVFRYEGLKTQLKSLLPNNCLIVKNRSKDSLKFFQDTHNTREPSQLLLRKLSDSLAAFTGRRVKISLSLANSYINLNRKAKTHLKQKFLALRRYSHYTNFFESLNVGVAVSKKVDFAKSLMELLIPVLTRSTRIRSFLRFMKKVLTLFIKNPNRPVYGVKIRIKGRVNGARRTKTLRLVVGDVACHSQELGLNYVSKTTHNSNGSYGLKIWVAGPR